ncbi:hypothetical protein IEQ34_016461 [Dendrobium chrysotoxum]|uniref:Uncharacterized protein n=1 Tax=Dendrobium chrysotoxum TaxID=161865 RepID=A0AAV7GFE8_DENCH|nr:hypothetical protein IEQ34_016461 [Dendrobium chrysotoxum]
MSGGGPTELRTSGGGPTELRASGGGPKKLRTSGSGPVELRMSGGGLVELKASGGGPAELKTSGGGLMELRTSSGGLAELRASGGGPAKLRISGGGPAELRMSGGGLAELRVSSGGTTELKTSGGGLAELRTSGGGPTELRTSCGGPAELRVSSGGPAELRTSGGGSAELRALGGGPAELRASGGGPMSGGGPVELRRWSGGTPVVIEEEQGGKSDIRSLSFPLRIRNRLDSYDQTIFLRLGQASSSEYGRLRRRLPGEGFFPLAFSSTSASLPLPDSWFAQAQEAEPPAPVPHWFSRSKAEAPPFRRQSDPVQVQVPTPRSLSLGKDRPQEDPSSLPASGGSKRSLGSLPASGGSERSPGSLSHQVGGKEFCTGFSALLWEQKKSHLVLVQYPEGRLRGVTELLRVFFANLHIDSSYSALRSFFNRRPVELTTQDFHDILQLSITGDKLHLISSDPNFHWSVTNQFLRGTNVRYHDNTCYSLLKDAWTIQHVLCSSIILKAGDHIHITPLLSLTTFYILAHRDFNATDLLLCYIEHLTSIRDLGHRRRLNLALGHIIAYALETKYNLSYSIPANVPASFFSNNSFHVLHSTRLHPEPSTDVEGEEEEAVPESAAPAPLHIELPIDHLVYKFD